MEQEEDHVVLGEELGHGRKLVSTDLIFGTVYFVLSLCLPELVHPPKSVIGKEDAAREIYNESL